MADAEIMFALQNADQSTSPVTVQVTVHKFAKSLADGSSKGKLQGPEDVLRNLKASKDWETRVYSIAGLAELNGKDATTSILKLLDDENATVRLEAARALRPIGGHRTKALVESVATNDPDKELRKTACTALTQLGQR